jgi:hypothetical protein
MHNADDINCFPHQSGRASNSFWLQFSMPHTRQGGSVAKGIKTGTGGQPLIAFFHTIKAVCGRLRAFQLRRDALGNAPCVVVRIL